MQIELLKAYPHYIIEIARWYQSEWGDLDPANSIDVFVRRLREFSNEGEIPVAFVACEHEKAVGACNIRLRREKEPNYEPWFAGLYVLPAFRKQGIGSALLAHAEKYAQKLGIETLYLSTPDQQKLYEQHGWREFDNTDFRGQRESIMQKRLR